MVAREIVWSVSKDALSITPNAPQRGAVQGEHNVTNVVFNIPDDCVLLGEGLKLYIGCTDSTGGYDKTEPLTVKNGCVEWLLPRAWTQYGGTDVLELTAEKENKIVYSVKARVVFESRPGTKKGEKKLLEGFMQAACDAAAESAERAAASEQAAAGHAVASAQNKSLTEQAARFVEERAASAAAASSVASGAANHASEFAGRAAEAQTAATASATRAEAAAAAAEQHAKAVSDGIEVAQNAANTAAAAATKAKASEEAADNAMQAAAEMAEDAAGDAAIANKAAKTAESNAAEAKAAQAATEETAKRAEQAVSEVFDIKIIKSKNLLDLATVTPNRNLTGSGAIYGQVSPNYAVSAHPDFGFEYIKVKGGTTYALQAFYNGGTALRQMRHIFAYNANKEIIEGSHAEYTSTYTTPDDAVYVCFSFSNDLVTTDDADLMFFEGDAVTEYEAYGDKVVTTFNAPVPVENVVGLTEFCTEVAEQLVGEATAEMDERLTTLEQNGSGVVEDGFVIKYVDGCYTNNNGKATLSNSATVAEAWECIVLDVSQNVGATLGIVTYTDKARPIFITDAGFNILGDPIAPNTGNPSLKFQTTATIPENATTLIINHYKGCSDVEVTGYMVDKYIRKDELVQELGYSEKAVMSQKAVNDAIKPHGDAIKKMAFSFRNVDAVCDRYSNEVGEVDLPKDTGTNRYIDPVKDIYALYDGLVAAYPGYVTRTLIGMIIPDDYEVQENDPPTAKVQTPNTAAWQQSGEQLPALTEALPLYRYDFTPPMLIGSKTDDVSKILYCSGTHGGEVAPVLQGFRFFKDLCDNWRTQDLLRALRFHCHFTVIPLVNPYGIKFDRKTNERGVNLNRNFSEQWPGVIEGAPGHGNDDDGTAASTYSGPGPASELETQLIEAMTASERFDFGLDHHTFSNFVGTAESPHGLHVGYFCSNDVGRPQDKSFADLAGIWISAKTVCIFHTEKDPLITDLSQSYCRTTAGERFNGYLFSAFPAGYCFETIFNWENNPDTSEMEARYPCQKFAAEVLGGIFHTAMVSYHSY